MRVGAIPRQHTDSVVKGEGVHPVGLGAIVALGKELKVLKDMKAAYIPSRQREDVINIKAGRAVLDEFIDLAHVGPLRKGVPFHGAPP